MYFLMVFLFLLLLGYIGNTIPNKNLKSNQLQKELIKFVYTNNRNSQYKANDNGK